MNKFGIVLGAAAVVTFAGCKDPDYKYASASPSQAEAKSVETTPAVETPVTTTTVELAVTPTCKCAPGTKHAEPCTCGAPDCKCLVEPVAVPVPAVAVEPAYTEYVVQEGDYLSKISKRYNVTISSILRLNPSIKKDVIRVGQKIRLPGKIDIGAQKVPARSAKVVKRSGSTVAYTGATKEYVVKNGDTLGSIAYGNGINIRQLKKLNGLSSDSLKIGQKLKIPAERIVNAPVAKKTAATVAPAPVQKAAEATTGAAPAPVTEASVAAETKDGASAVPAPAAATEAKADAAPAPISATPAPTYTVQEGDDMTGVSIRWGVTAAQIRELNNLGENDQLVPGQIIKLPAEAQQ